MVMRCQAEKQKINVFVFNSFKAVSSLKFINEFSQSDPRGVFVWDVLMF